MTLTTHALIGAAAASLFPEHPYIAFAAGFASHFCIDALPHWDYHEFLYSLHREPGEPLKNDVITGKHAWHDFALITADAVLGFVLTFVFAYVLKVPLSIALIGAGAGVYPDFLQFIYYKTHLEAMERLQRFHIWVQKGKSIYPQPLWGLSYQALLVLGVAAFTTLVRLQ